MTNRQKLWMLFPAWICFLADVSLTLGGQSESYWLGDFHTALEWNPVGRFFIVQGPDVFAALAVTWAVNLGVVVLLWRHPLAAWIPVVLAVAHASAGASWITRLDPWGWPLAVLYLTAASQFARFCWSRAGWIADSDVRPCDSPAVVSAKIHPA